MDDQINMKLLKNLNLFQTEDMGRIDIKRPERDRIFIKKLVWKTQEALKSIRTTGRIIYEKIDFSGTGSYHTRTSEYQ
jgi:hypothetical protein